ncbi:MAG: tetratricopeptide repeat protein [Proteobacteria bacterium]|nr:tetratricopeptide repeat protein [Pseudomonadota bacterium]
MLEAIEGLVLRSLLRREVLPGLGEVRFRLYATIRAFAERRAEDLSLSAGTASRTQMYFLALADKLGADIATRDRPEALRLLDEAVELSAGLSGQYRARTLCARGEARRLRGDFLGAEADLLPALALAQESKKDSLVGQVSRTLGALRYRQGRGEEAAEHYRRALEHAKAAKRPAAEAFAHGRLGAALQLVGRVPEAMEHYRQAIEMSRLLQRDRPGHLMVGSVIVVDLDENTTLDRDGVGYAALSHLFGATLPVGRAREAEKAFTQSLAYALDAGDQLGDAALTASLGLSRLDAAAAGEADALAQAEAHLQAALDIIEQFGNLLAEASIMGCLGRVHHSAGELERAESTLNESKLLARRIGARRVEAFVTAILGAVMADAGHANSAELLLEEARGLADEVGDHLALGVVQVATGHVDLARSDHKKARARVSAQVGEDDSPTPRKMAVGAVDIRLAMHALEQALARAEAD